MKDVIEKITDLELTPEEAQWLEVRKKPITVHALKMSKPFKVKSKEGIVQGKAGDYLMVGVEDELYINDATIFEKTYDILAQITKVQK